MNSNFDKTTYLNDDENDGSSLSDELKQIDDEAAVKTALKLSAIQNLTLPSDTVLTDRYERIANIIAIACGNNPNIMELTGQIMRIPWRLGFEEPLTL